MIATGFVTFIVTLFISAPYGRYQATKGWGWLIPPQIAWMLMESPNLFMPFIISFLYLGSWDGGYRRLTVSNGFLFGMYQFHYIHRSIIYPLFRINTSHHKAMPISVMFMAFAYCIWNGALQSLSLLVVLNRSETHLLHWNFGFGFVLYAIGFTINVKSDSILLSLKGEQSKNHSSSDNTVLMTSKKKGKVNPRNSPQSTDSTNYMNTTHDGMNNTIDVSNRYVIPYGGMFEFVSCANYYGEILEWYVNLSIFNPMKTILIIHRTAYCPRQFLSTLMTTYCRCFIRYRSYAF